MTKENTQTKGERKRVRESWVKQNPKILEKG